MLEFPFAEPGSDLPRYCSWQTCGEAWGLQFFREGKPLREPVVATAPERGQYALLDSTISGGTYRDFLEDALDRFDGKICLYLHPQTIRFPLPCPSGRGLPLPAECDLSDYQYSESLCAFWQMQVSPEPSLTLADSSRSIREKYRIAHCLGVPYLIAEPDVLKIAKAPCGQGALKRADTERDQ